TNEIRQNLNKDNSNYFEAYLILALDSLKKKDYTKSKDYLKKSYEFINNDKIALLLAEALKQYLYVFENNKNVTIKQNFGNFSLVNEAFQKCYLGDKSTSTYFDRIVKQTQDESNSRYVFFHTSYLVENQRYDKAKEVTQNLDYFNSSLLISQTKKMG
ncbi:hypothetical protein N9J95_01380, partial [Candidatus Pelagibacter sp.]|nr:hypothetical protein [Candidatus Pelagibacter sp.]